MPSKKEKGQIVILRVAFLLGLSMLHAEVFSSAFYEKKELESFFHHLCTKSEFGYTIFGNKPMTKYDYFVRPPHEFLIYSSIYEPKFEKWDKIYLKYKSLLSTQKFLIVDQSFFSKKLPTSGQVRHLIIINKEFFIKTIEENQTLFNERLGYKVNSEILLKKIEAGENVLQNVLNEDELLWGILLGYGVYNAKMFERWEDIQNDSCVPSAEFTSLEEERQYFDQYFFAPDFSDSWAISKVSLPRFMSIASHPETIALMNHYSEVQKRLCEILSDPNFCDLVLNRLGVQGL